MTRMYKVVTYTLMRQTKIESGRVCKMAKVIETFTLKYVKEQSVPYMDYMKANHATSPDKVAEIMNDIFSLKDMPEEYFYLLCLNTKNQITNISEVSHGSINASIVHPRDVFKRALVANSNAIILVHNHPSGNTSPSNEDINITNRLIECGNMLGVKVLDHIIIGHDDYLSFKEKNLL